VSDGIYQPPQGSIPTLDVPALEGVRTVHLIGAGGAGMRNLGRLLLARGIAVSGSDLKDSKGLRDLEKLGATIHVGHDASYVTSPDAVVISSAISETNVELATARERGLTVWARAQAIAALASGYRSIAVAGTHGKTTTTSMISVILEKTGRDPTYLIGGDLNESGSGARTGASDLFVFEADESDGSFLLTRPHVGIVTNVDVDHLDFYTGGSAEIRAAFVEFVRRCENVVACRDDEGVRAVLELTDATASTYGMGEGNDLTLRVTSPGPGGASGILRDEAGEELPLVLMVDGVHNLLNAAAAVVAAHLVGVDRMDSIDALRGFTGVHRRFELRGRARGADFYDDYGHVPAELEVTLDVARRTGPRRLVALFQPHRYSRTKELWRELGSSLTGADLILVTDVYGADQQPIPGVNGRLVVDGVRLADEDKPVVYLPHRQDAIDYLWREVREGDLVVTMGCGDVWMLGDAALAKIRETEP
jgi:UDP-N-acetylmuramate--alanine ligase